MISLFIDTCNKNITLGLLDDNKLLLSKSFINDNNLSEKLLPSIKELIKDAGFIVNDIKRIYVGIGPGSFTGIRIGVTVAKTLAWALKIDIIPISSLEIIASTTNEGNICSLIDARRGYVYASIYDSDLNNLLEDQYILLEDLKEHTSKYSSITYVGYEDIIDNISEPVINIEKVVNKHISDKPINPHKINPLYLKRTEAEEKHDRKD